MFNHGPWCLGFSIYYFLTNSIWNWVAGGDIEDVDVTAPQGKSSGTVLPFVGVACLGAILFGYHLGYDWFILEIACFFYLLNSEIFN